MKKLLCMLMALFVLAGCSSTKMTGFIDPEYAGYKISKAVVRIKGANLEETLAAEQRLADNLSSYGVDVIKYTDIAPPTRNYTLGQEANLLKKTKAGAVLIIYVAEKTEVETYIPPNYHAAKTTHSINGIGNMAYIKTHTTPAYTTGGYSISSPVMSTFSSLIDLRNGNEIWRGEGYSSGASSYLDLLISAGESATADLEQKGLISKIIPK